MGYLPSLARTLITRETSMEAIRKILSDAPDSVTIDLPPSFRHRQIEIVVTSLDAQPANADVRSAWPAGFFKHTAGAWSGEPLMRAPQGTAESRAALD
jgi:hypothetical protein